MSEDDIGAGGGGTSFVVREDLVQALITLGVSRNAAVRPANLSFIGELSSYDSFSHVLPPRKQRVMTIQSYSSETKKQFVLDLSGRVNICEDWVEVDRNRRMSAALYYTGNYNADLAAAWIFENQDRNLDAPLTEALEVIETSSDEDVVEEFLGDGSTYKMVFVVNAELSMGTGKIAGQVAHASVGLYRLLVEKQQQFGEMLLNWEQFGETKIVLKGLSTAHLNELESKATALGLPTFSVHDAGKTQIASGSFTVLSIMGKVETVNHVTGQLPLL